MSNPDFTTRPFESFAMGPPPKEPSPALKNSSRQLFPVDDATSIIMQPADVTPKPRGRPRTKVQPADVRQPTGPTSPFQTGAGGVPGSPPPRAPGSHVTGSTSTAKSVEDELRKKAEKKAKEIKDLTGKIVGDFNDQLLAGIITLGIPAGFLYKEGHGPVSEMPDSIYTPIGQAICINPMQANWIAHGILEAKEFPLIQKITLGGKEDGPSYFWLALGGLGMLSYFQGLLTAVTQMRKLMKEMQAFQAAMTNEEARAAQAGPAFQEQ